VVDCGRLCFVGLASALVGLVCLYPSMDVHCFVETPSIKGLQSKGLFIVCHECLFDFNLAWEECNLWDQRLLTSISLPGRYEQLYTS
jgi:hypothetical protein